MKTDDCLTTKTQNVSRTSGQSDTCKSQDICGSHMRVDMLPDVSLFCTFIDISGNATFHDASMPCFVELGNMPCVARVTSMNVGEWHMMPLLICVEPTARKICRVVGEWHMMPLLIFVEPIARKICRGHWHRACTLQKKTVTNCTFNFS